MTWLRIVRNALTRPPAPRRVNAGTVAALRERIEGAGQRRLGRSLAIRHVSAGSCGGCELELRATRNILYGLAQYGLTFTDSPRHADILLITGVAGHAMREAVLAAREAMADPAYVVAAGDCAVDGGVFKGSPAIGGGADTLLPVDLLIPGCPPTPGQIVDGLLALLEANAPPAATRRSARGRAAPPSSG